MRSRVFKAIVAAVLLAAACPAVAALPIVNQTFTGTNGTAVPTAYPSFTLGTGSTSTIEIESNNAGYAETGTNTYASIFWNADTFTTGQYASVQVANLSVNTDDIGAIVNHSGSAGTFYVARKETGNSSSDFFIQKYVAGVGTTLATGSSGTYTGFTEIYIKNDGSGNLTAILYNGSTALITLTATDTSITGGSAGFFFYGSNGPTTDQVSSFSAGDVSSGPTQKGGMFFGL